MLWREPNERTSQLSDPLGGAAVTIQDLGSLGELVGAVATVATLLYLAFQIRQNSHLLQSSLTQAERQGNVELQRILAGDSAAARIMRIGMSDPSSLTDDERLQFGAQMGVAFAAMDQSQQLGSLKDRYVRDFLEHPGPRDHWEKNCEVYSDSLKARVQAIIGNKLAARPAAAADSA
jgi:hypothetical protein